MTDALIFTLGHSNRNAEEFLALVAQANLDTIADVRTTPRSRFPWFNQQPLADLLESIDVSYEPRGKNLGGKGRNVDFDETLDLLADRARGGERIGLLCSEGDYRQCHRFYMLTQPLLDRGLEVQHLRWDGTIVVQRPGEAPIPTPEPKGQAQRLW